MEENEDSVDRGLHIVVINPFNGILEWAIVFDTYLSSDELDCFITSDIPEGYIVVASCKDDCVTNLSHYSKLWFESMGSKEIW